MAAYVLAAPFIALALAWKLLIVTGRLTGRLLIVLLSLLVLGLSPCLGASARPVRQSMRGGVIPLLFGRHAADDEPEPEPEPEPVVVAPVPEPVDVVAPEPEPVIALEPEPVASEPTVVRELHPFEAPVLGWSKATGEEVRWHPAGAGRTVLQNGHTEIWGSSGMGKTQFVMALLAQLAHHSGSRFSIADFKNDYSAQTGFPQLTGASFVDLWNEGAAYNPLALDGDDDSQRAIETAVIELRDVVDEAASAFGRLGRRQRTKLETFLTRAYELRETEDRWPTLRDLNGFLDADLDGVLGDLTRHELFRSGPPLGNVIDENVVFGLSRIPGNGQTTVLAAGFILSSLLTKIQNLPPVPNTIRHLTVIDEAHRISPFRAVQTMVREARSKGAAVLLATQQPQDLPDVVAANAQTKICFGLPDAAAATVAARRLDPDSPRLTEQIRSLPAGEAFVSFAGQRPMRLRMAQAWRDQTLVA